MTKRLQNPFLFWWVFAVTSRFLSAITFSHWFHPDEWCQTFEPANMIAHGFGFHSQETGLHLRNLSWPVILAAVLKFLHWIIPGSIDLRVFAVNFICGTLDLFILWGWQQLLNQPGNGGQWSTKEKNWSLVLLLGPWFALYDSINPRAEHLSAIALWIALGCIVREFWILAGIASIGIFAFRYPSGLFSLGIFLAILIQTIKTKKSIPLVQFLKGSLIGLVLFGLSDWVIYGRPWESLWMYLQYNIFTGSSNLVFGRQGISAYAELFAWDWTTYKTLIPLGLFLLLSSVYGFWNGIKKWEPWAICIFIYFLGHLLVPHKEARFMVPVEVLLRWSAFVGAVFFLKTLHPRAKVFAGSILILTLISNAFLFVHALRADLWKELGTYRELGSFLKSHPQTCAILTVRDVTSILMPFQNGAKFPSPPIASFQGTPDLLFYDGSKSLDLSWYETGPNCSPNATVLLHTRKAETGWAQEGCKLLPSGILRVLPETTWDWALRNNKVSGAWYECTPEIFKHFRSQNIKNLYSHSFGRFSSLPPLGITPQDLENLGHQTSPPPKDAYLPTLAHPSFLER